jgi:replication factor C small subunit
MMWVEKYRPGKLDELVDQENVKERLRQLLTKKDELPHLLFAGPPGSGKTTTAIIIAKQLLGEAWNDYTLSLNASNERGIDMVRERVKTFSRYADRREGVPFRLIILDEADEMCLHPDTSILVGKLEDLREISLAELYQTHGNDEFDLPSFGTRGMRLENDTGRILPSGSAELYRITFEDGRSVLASAEHPFFVIRGTMTTTIQTKDINPGAELAEFSDRVLRCYNCSRPFFRPYQWGGYLRHFCSRSCGNVFLGSISIARSREERREISLKGPAALLKMGTYRSEAYRLKRADIAKRLIRAGRIPDPRTWRKYKRGEGAWLGKKLSEEHKRAIGEGDAKFFREHPEVRLEVSMKLRKSLSDPAGSYQKLVRTGFFKKLSRKAYLASLEHWKRTNFRSKTELTMARLLEEWGVPYERECLILTSSAGHTYPFTIDFVIGQKIALLVNGCWWHVCPTCGVRPQYEKQLRNMAKDERHEEELARLGYKVVTVWEHELQDNKMIHDQVLPRIFQSIGIAGGAPPKVKHCIVRSIERAGPSPVLNITVTKNRNFLLANGILTHNTSDAQHALRRIMEESSKFTRFILICNYSSGIIDPLQSRTAIFRFQRLDEASVVPYLKEISKKEKLKIESESILSLIYQSTNGDLRQAINLLQAVGASGSITVDRVKSVTGSAVKGRVAEIMKLALAGGFDEARLKMIELTRVYGIPERDFLKFANEELGNSKTDDMTSAIKILAEYDYRLVQGAQPELQLTAMLAELSALKKGKGANS